MEFLQLSLIERFKEKLPMYTENIIEHCQVSWTVNNFFYCDAKTQSLQSPGFHLAKKLTTWHISMSTQFEKNTVSLYLQRDRFDDGARYVNVSFCFGLKKDSTEEWHAETTCRFRNCTLEVMHLNNVSTYYNAENKQLTILCRMVVVCELETSCERCQFLNFFDTNYGCDYFNLYERNFLTDVTLQVHDCRIKAHKAILAARSPYFKKILAKANRSNLTLDLTKEMFDSLNGVILYMYIGNIDIWLQFFPITTSFCDLIEKFDVGDLKKLLEPNKITMVSDCDIKNSPEYSWYVNDFTDVLKKLYDDNPRFEVKFGVITFVIRLAIVEDAYISLLVKPYCVVDDLVVRLECSIIREGGEKYRTCEVTQKLENKKEFGIIKFIEKNELVRMQDSLYADNIFTMRGKFQMSKFETTDKLVDVKGTTKNRDICEKITNLGCLLKTSLYSDFRLIVGDNQFKVHQAILWSRSTYFRNKISSQTPDETYIRITDLSYEETRAMLQWIYFEELDTNNHTAFELLRKQAIYGIPALDIKLKQYLISKINNENACIIFVKASEREVVSVMKSAQHTINHNFEDIGLSRAWNEFCNLYCLESYEVLSDLADIYKRSQRINIPTLNKTKIA